MANATGSTARRSSIGNGNTATKTGATKSDFFALPFRDRDAEKQKLPEELQNRINTDQERIIHVRNCFEKDRRKAHLLSKVNLSLVAWRKEVLQREQSPDSKEIKRREKDERERPGIRILKASREPTPQTTAPPARASPIAHASAESSRLDDEDSFGGFRVGVMHFEEEKDGSGFHGTNYHNGDVYAAEFPNQKASIYDVLYNEEHNPFTCEKDRIKYLHFPANHMGWIEQAIARHYEETGKSKEERHRTNHVLSREHWRGQLHGSGLGKSPIHARHMRSRCSSIPLDTQSGAFAQDDAANLALFMPYLHWETNKGRARMAQVVREVKEKEEKEKEEQEQRPRPIKTFKVSKGDTNKGHLSRKTLSRFGTDAWRKRRFADIARQVMKKSSEKYANKTNLGQYLFNAAELWHMMAFEADERLIRHSLRGEFDSPLHIRRTLDQSYFLTLEDTTTRDKDQVVYRATKPSNRHPYNVTRVVMVDQLWLWILGERTIITSFPRRWGRNKPDSSGVHKSLRDRLQLSHGKINSVYHLALLIIDQCSRVFFDRTQPTDLRPEVMDLFAEAIGKMTDHTTHAFANFWTNVRLSNVAYDTQLMNGQARSKARHEYLDINPEGEYLRESQDIAEELRIMGRIFNQQLSVVKDFRKDLNLHRGGYRMDASEHGIHKLTRQLERILQSIHQDTKDKKNNNNQQVDDKSDRDMQVADDFIEQITNRHSEIAELELAIEHTTHELKELLNLKQQQASIVEAQAALERADESVRQGRAIMAFTMVTIFFLPLGFFATFFGMNNEDINEAHWMTLDEQIKYMFSLSAAVITISLSMAFFPGVRLAAKSLIYVPLNLVWRYSGLRLVWEGQIRPWCHTLGDRMRDWRVGQQERKEDLYEGRSGVELIRRSQLNNRSGDGGILERGGNGTGDFPSRSRVQRGNRVQMNGSHR